MGKKRLLSPVRRGRAGASTEAAVATREAVHREQRRPATARNDRPVDDIGAVPGGWANYLLFSSFNSLRTVSIVLLSVVLCSWSVVFCRT